MAGILFEDIFDVKDIDPDGKKFDRGTLNKSYWMSSLVHVPKNAAMFNWTTQI